jgi:hypothetical protein
MDLEINPLVHVHGKGKIHRVDELPAEDQGHFVPRVEFRLSDFSGHDREVVISGFGVDLPKLRLKYFEQLCAHALSL